MSGLNRSSNPYLKGMKPRRFFQGLTEQLKKTKDLREFNPNWIKKKVA